MRRRGRLWRDNPLRRRSDVLEGRLMLALAVAALVAAPAAGTAVGRTTYDDVRAQARAERAERHPARAELTRDAPWKVTSAGPDALTVEPKVPVRVRWTTPGGGTRTAVVTVDSGLKRGDRIGIWLDRQGALTVAPLNPSDALGRSVVAGTTAGSAAIGALLIAGWAARRAFDRRRLAGWESEWAAWDGEGRGRQAT
ncbi:Rv1733c family protein [Streptomyces sp. WG-D5]